MLMHRQILSQKARQHFHLRRDPFGDLTCRDDMYISGDIRYIREAMYQAAKYDDFLAVVGESGSGKSTLRRDLISRLKDEGAPVIVIEPYVLAMEDSDHRGKTLRSTHIAEAMLAAIAPTETLKSSPEARFAQLHRKLKDADKAGKKVVVILEEAHAVPEPTLNHLKRFRELEDGFRKLVSIILIGQPELLNKLSPRNSRTREVAQRIAVAQLAPIPFAELEKFLSFRFGRACDSAYAAISNFMENEDAFEALRERLTLPRKSADEAGRSLLYPLAIGNLLTAAMNDAVDLGEAVVTADIIRDVRA